MTFNKIYFLKNFETEETKSFSENKITIDELVNFNNKGWNIYESVNTFKGNKRNKKDIAEIKSCFVDIDYPEILKMNDKERALFLKTKFEEIKEKLLQIQHEFDIFPNTINITYKWFHILFNYEESCYFIDNETHLKVNNKINDILWWDENARDIARVFKSIGFIDWKGWKKWKIKQLDIKISNKNINIDVIKNKFNLSPSFRKVEKQIKEKKEEAIDKYNNFSAFDVIDKLNTILSNKSTMKFLDLNETEIQEIKNKIKYKKISENLYKLYEEDGLNLTSWLTIEKTNWIWNINDYSKKTRRGNYNFLKNWIFIHPKLSGDYKKIYPLLKEIFWFAPNIDSQSILTWDYKLMGDIAKDNLWLNNKIIKKDKNLIELEFNNKFIDEDKNKVYKEIINPILWKINSYGKAPLIAISTLVKETKKNIDSNKNAYYKIYWSDFFNRLWLSPNSTVKKNYMTLLIYLWQLQIIQPWVDADGKDINIFENLFKVWFSNTANHIWKWNKDFFLIYPIYNEDFIFSEKGSIASISTKVLKYKTTQTLFKSFLIDLDWTFKNTDRKVHRVTFDEFFKLLNLNQNEYENLKKVKFHLEKSKKETWIFKDYEIDKKSKNIELYKFSQKKS